MHYNVHVRKSHTHTDVRVSGCKNIYQMDFLEIYMFLIGICFYKH